MMPFFGPSALTAGIRLRRGTFRGLPNNAELLRIGSIYRFRPGPLAESYSRRLFTRVRCARD
jgi:hypothetical protein